MLRDGGIEHNIIQDYLLVDNLCADEDLVVDEDFGLGWSLYN